MKNLGICRIILVLTAFFWGNTLVGYALDSRQITDLILAARQGDTRAMRELARAYYDGDGMLKDPVTAKCWARQAYDLGDPKAEKLWNELELWKYAGDCSSQRLFREVLAEKHTGDHWQDPFTGMVFVWISGGCFPMGCHENAGRCRKNEFPAHRVCLDGYWMMAHEVTQGQWQALMGKNPSRFQETDTNPVEMVSFEQVREFILELNQQSAHRFSLPTEAQWEYACRDRGRKIPFAWGKEDFLPRANCGTCDNTPYSGRTAPVDSFYANDPGLFHMGGNVGEWCKDIYNEDAYQVHEADNPVFKGDGRQRVVRGGAYSDNVSDIGCTRRQGMMPAMKSERVGFRLVVKRRF